MLDLILIVGLFFSVQQNVALDNQVKDLQATVVSYEKTIDEMEIEDSKLIPLVKGKAIKLKSIKRI